MKSDVKGKIDGCGSYFSRDGHGGNWNVYQYLFTFPQIKRILPVTYNICSKQDDK